MKLLLQFRVDEPVLGEQLLATGVQVIHPPALLGTAQRSHLVRYELGVAKAELIIELGNVGGADGESVERAEPWQTRCRVSKYSVSLCVVL